MNSIRPIAERIFESWIERHSPGEVDESRYESYAKSAITAATIFHKAFHDSSKPIMDRILGPSAPASSRTLQL